MKIKNDRIKVDKRRKELNRKVFNKDIFDKKEKPTHEDDSSLCSVAYCESELMSDIDSAPIKYAIPKVINSPDLDLNETDEIKPWCKQRYRIDLAAQQAECELNYVRLSRLLVDLPTNNEWCFEIGDSQIQTYLVASIQDRAPYTTTIQLIQCNASSIDDVKKIISKHSQPALPIDNAEQKLSETLRSSSITVCMYHDANMAEVITWKNHKRLRARYEYPNKDMYHQDEKAQLNKFLGEWLTLCQKKGRVVMALADMGFKYSD
ncbi:MAG: DUF1249 domain-containing protein [Cellvibrionaceae bacterium]